MIEIPMALALFILGLFVSLVSYIWAHFTRKIDMLFRKIAVIDKFQGCEPVTMQQIKDLFDARFNEFRLELYKSGVLKPGAVRGRKANTEN